jgi:hypothetical protein
MSVRRQLRRGIIGRRVFSPRPAPTAALTLPFEITTGQPRTTVRYWTVIAVVVAVGGFAVHAANAASIFRHTLGSRCEMSATVTSVSDTGDVYARIADGRDLRVVVSFRWLLRRPDVRVGDRVRVGSYPDTHSCWLVGLGS